MKHSKAVEREFRYFKDLISFKLPDAEKQALARRVRDAEGIEMTPAEAEFMLAKALGTIRRRMIDRGYREFETMTIFEVRDAVQDSRRLR